MQLIQYYIWQSNNGHNEMTMRWQQTNGNRNTLNNRSPCVQQYIVVIVTFVYLMFWADSPMVCAERQLSNHDEVTEYEIEPCKPNYRIVV
jgi:hypothetical protein